MNIMRVTNTCIDSICAHAWFWEFEKCRSDRRITETVELVLEGVEVLLETMEIVLGVCNHTLKINWCEHIWCMKLGRITSYGLQLEGIQDFGRPWW